MPAPSPASTWTWPRVGRMPVAAWVAVAFFAARGNGQEVDRLEIGGATLNVSFDAVPAAAFRQLTLEWITRAANAVTVYYTAFPVRRADIAVHVIKGTSVRHGTASGEGGAHITVTLGSEVSARALAEGNDNWLMTHEMVHLALTGVEGRHHWLEEGLATYVEPIARVRSGELNVHQVWRDMVEGMPNGEPGKGDAGLDQTPTWGRTYWGGALFCLLADVEIRKRTGNQKGLENALRAIVAAGGTIETDWGLFRVLEIGDKAVGAPVLVPLYDRMKDDPSPVDLISLWQQLGVEEKGDTVVFHDDAPLAGVRNAIMRR